MLKEDHVDPLREAMKAVIAAGGKGAEDATQVCPPEMPWLWASPRNFEDAEGVHGDVCFNSKRHHYGEGWTCPAGCEPSSEDRATRPYCVNAGSTKVCRAGSSMTRRLAVL